MSHRTVTPTWEFARNQCDPDIWFHASDSPETAEEEFKPGCRVEFSIFRTLGTARAVRVRVLPDGAIAPCWCQTEVMSV